MGYIIGILKMGRGKRHRQGIGRPAGEALLPGPPPQSDPWEMAPYSLSYSLLAGGRKVSASYSQQPRQTR